METKATPIAGAPDIAPAPVEASVRPAQGGKAPAPTVPDPVEMRLVIEEDQASGSYVYKTINRQTGEVVQQLPRAEVLKLRQELQYAVGTVIRTKA